MHRIYHMRCRRCSAGRVCSSSSSRLTRSTLRKSARPRTPPPPPPPPSSPLPAVHGASTCDDRVAAPAAAVNCSTTELHPEPVPQPSPKPNPNPGQASYLTSSSHRRGRVARRTRRKLGRWSRSASSACTPTTSLRPSTCSRLSPRRRAASASSTCLLWLYLLWRYLLWLYLLWLYLTLWLFYYGYTDSGYAYYGRCATFYSSTCR